MMLKGQQAGPQSCRDSRARDTSADITQGTMIEREERHDKDSSLFVTEVNTIYGDKEG